MIRRSFVLSAAAMSLTLAGCGSNSPTPSPTPTPSPSPTATASPTPVSYSTFPLTAATEFGTINAFLSYTGDPAVGPVVLGVSGTESGSTRFRLAALPDPTVLTVAAPQVVRENTEEGRYIAPAELIVPPATGVTEYVFNNTLVTKATVATTVAGSRAEFLNNTVAGKVTSDPALALLRVSYAGWIRDDSAAGNHRITYGVWGYPTVATDMPTTGTVTYSARIAGRTVGVVAAGTGSVQRLGGTVTVTINFATGAASVTANVTTVGAGGAESPYGTFSGTGAIASGATQFTGAFGPTSPIPGTFTGALFGPQGAEIGISFAASGNVGATDTRLVGVVVGKKN
jgi:hypothetical protein